MLKHKKYFGILAVVVLAMLIVHGDVFELQKAFAQGAGQQVRGNLGEPATNLMSIMGIFISFFQVIALIALWIVQYLLAEPFLNDPEMTANLLQIWILSRDLMNVGFALMLIGVAIYTIITSNKDKIQQYFVRFAVAVVLVNFSWFFPRVIIDIANVLTSTIYSIPNMLPGFLCVTRDDNGVLQPCKVLLEIEILPQPARALAFCPAADPNCGCLNGLVCYRTGDFITATQLPPGHAMINGLAVSFARINALARVPATPLAPGGANQNILTVSINLLMTSGIAMVLLMASALALIALAVGLVIRMIILWVCVAFMPFVFIGFVVNGKLGIPGLPGEYDLWENFKTAAFLPTVVAIPFCIGFIMLSSTAQIDDPTTGLTIGTPLLSGINNLYAFMWQCAAIGIIYVGAFTALNSNKLIGKFTDKIKGFGDSAVGVATEATKLIPLPMPGLNNRPMTVGQLTQGPRLIQQAINQSAMTGKPLRETLAALRNGSSTATGVNTDAANKTLRDNPESTNRIVNAIQGLNGLNGAAREAKLTELRQELARTGVIQHENQLTNNNVLKEVRRIAERPNSTLAPHINSIDTAIKSGAPPPTPPR